MSRTREFDALIPILERAQISHDSVLVVHSAIAHLSRRGFRAEAMIEAFLDYMIKGTLVMPTMTWRTVTPERPRWDELSTPSHTGVLSEIFRTRYATSRSIHPTHSVAACGSQAQGLLSRHHLDDTPVSPNSPYGLMRDTPAYLLMIGVGLESCTAIHLPEETIAPDIYLRPSDQTEVYECRDRHGAVHQVRTRRHWRLDRDFPKFGPVLAVQKCSHTGQIEGCDYMLVSLSHLLGVVTDALRADRSATLKQANGSRGAVPTV
jgi:aminoglycoside 3-N-acetyltransferase